MHFRLSGHGYSFSRNLAELMAVASCAYHGCRGMFVPAQCGQSNNSKQLPATPKCSLGLTERMLAQSPPSVLEDLLMPAHEHRQT